MTALGAVVAGCLTGCGSNGPYLNGVVVERAIASSFLKQQHVYTRVLCPSHIPQRQGHVFRCSAGFDVGSYGVQVTETNSAGHVHWSEPAPVHLLKIKNVSTAIRQSVLAQRGARSTVTCPARVLQQKGLTFTCNAVVRPGPSRVKARTYPFKVSQTDNAGHVSYVQG